MTPKQQRFCDEYLIDLNGTQAAIRAGYSKKTANVIADQNLSKLYIKEYIQARKREIANKLEITQERIIQEYAKLAFFDIRTIYTESNSLKNVGDFDDNAAGAVAGIEVLEEFSGRGDEREHIGNTVKVKLGDKKGALDSLAKHLGMFEKDNNQRKPEAGTIQVRIISPTDDDE